MEKIVAKVMSLNLLVQVIIIVTFGNITLFNNYLLDVYFDKFIVCLHFPLYLSFLYSWSI